MRCRSTAQGPGVAAPTRPDVVIAGLKEERTFGFARAGHLDANVGYLELFNFPSLERAKAPVDEAMKHLAGSKALIIDLRRNGGGSPDSIRYICSYLFDKPTHINSIYWRSSHTARSTSHAWTARATAANPGSTCLFSDLESTDAGVLTARASSVCANRAIRRAL